MHGLNADRIAPRHGAACHHQPAAAADLFDPHRRALIMLAGIYYGAQYGDSVSAITMKIPHASSIVRASTATR
jgi:hypothetical protein